MIQQFCFFLFIFSSFLKQLLDLVFFVEQIDNLHINIPPYFPIRVQMSAFRASLLISWMQTDLEILKAALHLKCNSVILYYI
ncbi:unnamed protein product [Prunus brigantina]